MSYYIIPLFLLTIIIWGAYKKVNCYEAFIKGAKEGLKMAVTLFPFMLSMIFATSLLRASHMLEDLFSHVRMQIPPELLIQGLFRPLSGNAAFAVMIDIYNIYGVDSKVALASSILEGTSDTTIYVITLYFGSVGIKKYRYAIKAGLIADLIGFVITLFILFFLL